MLFRRFWMLSLLVLAWVTGSSANALQPNEVLLLYNSQNPTSLAIRNAYIAARPGVQQFDLNLAYPAVLPGQARSSTPPAGGLNNQFITRDAFSDLFLNSEDQDSLQAYLEDHPEILAIATTRGLPAAICSDFNPTSGCEANPPPYGMIYSFESSLAAGVVLPGSGTGYARFNPYFAVNIPYSDFRSLCGAYGAPGILDYRTYLVTRLDVALGDEATEEAYRDAVISLIERSTNLVLNRSGVNVVVDRWSSANGAPVIDSASLYESSLGPDFAVATYRMWQAGFRTLFDDTALFVHGMSDPLANAGDAVFNDAPILALLTYGTNHTYLFSNGNLQGSPPGGEVMARDYNRYYAPHPAGMMFALESYSGWSLHSPRVYPCARSSGEHPGQAQGGRWIETGGSFAIVFVDEPAFTSSIPKTSYIMPNLYINGLTWAEAAYSGYYLLGSTQTALGDPLARVDRVYVCDLNGDRVVDEADRAIVLVHQEEGAVGLPWDIDGDGICDSADLAILDSVFGRTSLPAPNVPVVRPMQPPWTYRPFGADGKCQGDLDGDGCVTSADLAIITQVIASGGVRCPDYDVNGDGRVDSADAAIVAARVGLNVCDVNDDGVVNFPDLNAVLSVFGTTSELATFNARADFNCDDVINFNDLNQVLSNYGRGCP